MKLFWVFVGVIFINLTLSTENLNTGFHGNNTKPKVHHTISNSQHSLRSKKNLHIDGNITAIRSSKSIGLKQDKSGNTTVPEDENKDNEEEVDSNESISNSTNSSDSTPNNSDSNEAPAKSSNGNEKNETPNQEIDKTENNNKIPDNTSIATTTILPDNKSNNNNLDTPKNENVDSGVSIKDKVDTDDSSSSSSNIIIGIAVVLVVIGYFLRSYIFYLCKSSTTTPSNIPYSKLPQSDGDIELSTTSNKDQSNWEEWEDDDAEDVSSIQVMKDIESPKNLPKNPPEVINSPNKYNGSTRQPFPTPNETKEDSNHLLTEHSSSSTMPPHSKGGLPMPSSSSHSTTHSIKNDAKPSRAAKSAAPTNPDVDLFASIGISATPKFHQPVTTNTNPNIFSIPTIARGNGGTVYPGTVQPAKAIHKGVRDIDVEDASPATKSKWNNDDDELDNLMSDD